jgi:hypothetical protein
MGWRRLALLLTASSLSVPPLAAAQTAAPPLPTVVSTVALGPLGQASDILARDGGYSLQVGATDYWMFDDTIWGQSLTRGGFIDNTLSWTTSPSGLFLEGNLTNTQGEPVPFIPFTAAETRWKKLHSAATCGVPPCRQDLSIWPSQPILDTANQRVIMPIYALTRTPGINAWYNYASGFAAAPITSAGKLGPFKRMPVLSGSGYQDMLWGPNDFAYLDQSIIFAAYFYAFGNAYNAATGQIDTKLARVPLAKLSTLSAWTYWDAAGTWSSNPANAVPLFAGGDAGSSIFFNGYLGEWMAIYTPAFQGDVYFRVANGITGPWSAQALLFHTSPGYNNSDCYHAQVHTEMALNGGQTEFVSYSKWTGPFIDQTQMVKVTFAPAAGK